MLIRYASALCWLKRDFRLADNPALTAALAESRQVVALLLVEPSLLAAPETSAFHVQAWLTAANELRAALRVAGSELIVVRDEAIPGLEQIRQRWPFAALYSHQEVSTDLTYRRDRIVQRWCHQRDIPWHQYPQMAVVRRLASRDDRQPLWHDWTHTPTLAAPSGALLGKTALPAALKPLSLTGSTGIPGFPWSMPVSAVCARPVLLISGCAVYQSLGAGVEESLAAGDYRPSGQPAVWLSAAAGRLGEQY